MRELISPIGVLDVLFEPRLEVLERGKRLPAGVHLDVQVLVGLHVIQRQQVERNGRRLGVGESLPCRLCIKARMQALNLPMDRIDHDEHGLDGRIGSPHIQVPRLVDDPRRRHVLVLRQWVGGEPLAEQAGARPGRIRETGPSRTGF